MEAEVIQLAALRDAQRAAKVLDGLMHEAPWLVRIRVGTRAGLAVITVLVSVLDEQVRCCLPTHVNNFPVEVQALGKERVMGPVVRVELFNDDVNALGVALLYSLEEAGMVRVHGLDPEVGGLFDIFTRDAEQAGKLQHSLAAYGLKAAVVVNPN